MGKRERQRERLAELRQRHRPEQPSPEVPAGHVLVEGQPVHWARLLEHVAQVREAADALERGAVEAGRADGVSWDRLSLALRGRPSGEQLRRRYTRG